MSTARSLITPSLLLGLILAALAIPACAPSSKEIASANFGPPPDHCERLIQQELDLTLFSGHPGDYIFDKPPYKAVVNRSILAGPDYGWVVEFQAKGPVAFGSGGYRVYHCFFPTAGPMVLLTNDAIIRNIDK